MLHSCIPKLDIEMAIFTRNNFFETPCMIIILQSIYFFLFVLHSSFHMCTYKFGRSHCRGDSGGPFLVKDPEIQNGRFEIVNWRDTFIDISDKAKWVCFLIVSHPFILVSCIVYTPCPWRYTEIGVASFGPSSGCGEYPAGFTRINPVVLDWITEVTTGIFRSDRISSFYIIG